MNHSGLEKYCLNLAEYLSGLLRLMILFSVGVNIYFLEHFEIKYGYITIHVMMQCIYIVTWSADLILHDKYLHSTKNHIYCLISFDEQSVFYALKYLVFS